MWFQYLKEDGALHGYTIISWKDMKKIISHFLSDLGQNGDRVSEKDRKDQYLNWVN